MSRPILTNYVGTHDQRLAMPVARLAQGTTFWETDRLAQYTVSGGTWVLSSGAPVTAAASLPTDLGTADTGYLTTDPATGINYRWDGAAFQVV